MRNLLLSAVGAIALIGSATANAAVVVTVPSPPIFTPPTSGGAIGQVSPSAGATATTTTSFSDLFTFFVNTSSQFSAQISNTSLGTNGQGNINFGNILVDGVGGLFTLVSLPGAAETWACCGVGGSSTMFLSAGSHTITIPGTLTGNVLGTYAATVNFGATPLPESATWAMMLLGFGGIGLALRRRRQPVLAQLA